MGLNPHISHLGKVENVTTLYHDHCRKSVQYFNWEAHEIKILKEISDQNHILVTAGYFQGQCQFNALHAGTKIYTSFSRDVLGFFKNGKLHREDDLPAVIWASGMREWYIDGQHHRVSGPATLLLDHSQKWYQNNVPHRIDGPAIIEAQGKSEWWENGKLHRIDGAAREMAGLIPDEYWIKGVQLSENQFRLLQHYQLVEKWSEYQQEFIDYSCKPGQSCNG